MSEFVEYMQIIVAIIVIIIVIFIVYKVSNSSILPSGSAGDIGKGAGQAAAGAVTGYYGGVATAIIDLKERCENKYPAKTIGGTAYGNAFEHWIGGKCYSCPSKYKRTIEEIDSPQACSTDCPSGYSWDVGAKSCWKCPANTSRNAFQSVLNPKACVKNCSKYHDPLDNYTFKQDAAAGKCYACKDGGKRSIHSVNGDKACYTGSALFPTNFAAKLYPDYVAASIVKPYSPTLFRGEA